MMTQYTAKVERHALLMEAKEWAMQIKGIHIHGLTSMWYETRPQDFEGGRKVTDTEFNCGVIKRHIDGELVHQFNSIPTDEELLDMFEKKCS